MNKPLTSLALAAGLASLVPAASSAQQPPATCEGGRVASEATAGRCCWPNQVWSAEHGRCDGPPACPAGTAPNGDDCVASTVPPPPNQSAPPVMYAPPPQQTYPPGPQPSYEPTPQLVDTGETRPTMGLLIPGIAVFGAFWIITAVTSAFVADVSGDNEGLINIIPAAGPLICAFSCGVDGTGLKTLLVMDSVFQFVGIALFIAGLAIQRPVQRRVAETEDGPSLALIPWLGADRAGMSLVGTSF